MKKDFKDDLKKDLKKYTTETSAGKCKAGTEKVHAKKCRSDNSKTQVKVFKTGSLPVLQNVKSCIACSGRLKKLFSIENMPATAQDIPDFKDLKNDNPADITIMFCTGCGLVQLGEGPVYYYRDVIRAGGGSSTMYELRKKQYEKFIEIGNLKNKKIIEAGCGAGEFLELFKDFNVQAYGIEHNEELAQKARDKGLDVETNFPENEYTVFKHAPFDAFCSFNFLEHQPDPLGYLRAIYSNISDDGFGLITVPDLEYIINNKGYYEIIPDHIAYYTVNSLTTLLNNAGFEVLSSCIVNFDTIEVIVKKRKAPDFRPVLKQKDEIEKTFDSLFKRAEVQNKSVAIWGAGHQGFTLCATMLLKNKADGISSDDGYKKCNTGDGKIIKYIIDSAKFKQGKYAPASHIPIISPQAALEDPADIIIIVAPGYSSEIENIIKRDFRPGTEIYTLKDDLNKLT